MTLVEALVALALAGLVSAAVVTVLTTQGRVVRALTAQAADADAHRIAAAVLRAELRWLVPGTDVRAIAEDSIAVRLYRGSGGVCALGADRLRVRYVGDRLPAPEKDSVLVRGRAAASVHALAGVEHTLCEGVPALELRLADAAPPDGAAVLVFESGTYFVRDRALRYRLGAAGRQPITDERFASSAPALQLLPGLATVVVPIAWPAELARAPDSVRIHFANTR